MAASKTTKKTTPDKVKVTLAHPISRERDLAYLGLPLDLVTHPGDEIEVPHNAVSSLISAGLITVDPEDHEAVAELTGQPVIEQMVVTPA